MVKYGRRGFASLLRSFVKTGPLSGWNPPTDYAQMLGLPALFGFDPSPPAIKDTPAAPWIDVLARFNTEIDGQSQMLLGVSRAVNFNVELDREAFLPSTRITRSVKNE